jgi:hypothetical protein
VAPATAIFIAACIQPPRFGMCRKCFHPCIDSGRGMNWAVSGPPISGIAVSHSSTAPTIQTSAAGYRRGSDRGSRKCGRTLLSKRVIAQIRSPARARTSAARRARRTRLGPATRPAASLAERPRRPGTSRASGNNALGHRVIGIDTGRGANWAVGVRPNHQPPGVYPTGSQTPIQGESTWEDRHLDKCHSRWSGPGPGRPRRFRAGRLVQRVRGQGPPRLGQTRDRRGARGRGPAAWQAQRHMVRHAMERPNRRLGGPAEQFACSTRPATRSPCGSSTCGRSVAAWSSTPMTSAGTPKGSWSASADQLPCLEGICPSALCASPGVQGGGR